MSETAVEEGMTVASLSVGQRTAVKEGVAMVTLSEGDGSRLVTCRPEDGSQGGDGNGHVK